MEAFNGKLIVITAPSGAGKTTIVRHLLETYDNLAFSVSATSRGRRSYEQEGLDYYFLSPEAFRKLVDEDAFLEWEEVYEDQFYGTLRSEVTRLWSEGKHIIFDIDVQGAMNIQRAFPEQTLSIFVKPPSEAILFERLRGRQTETEESLRKRIEKATLELGFENKFDRILVNDVLEQCLQEAEAMVSSFLQA